jgi:hypothetical protein
MNDPHKQLIIEIAVNRLVLRALLASLFRCGDQGRRLAKSVLAAAEAMAPQALRLGGSDIETQTEAGELLWKRTMAVLAELEHPSDHSDGDGAETPTTI